MNIAFRVSLAMTVLITWACLEIVARVRHPSRVFTIHLERAMTPDDQRMVRRFRQINGGTALLAIAIGMLGPISTALFVFVSLLMLIPVAVLTIEIRNLAKSIGKPTVSGRYVIPIDVELRARDLVSPALQTINLLLMLLSALVFTWLVKDLPENVPLHWNTSGHVDRWGSPHEMWLMLGLLLFNTGLMWGVALIMAKERVALPEQNQDRYLQLQRERRSLIVRMLEAIELLVNAAFAFLWILIAMAWHSNDRSTVEEGGLIFFAITGLAVVVPLWVYLRPLMRVQDALKGLGGEALGTRPDGWRWHGLVYYAPEDPAILVPKLRGVGQTINFARPRIWVYLFLGIGLPILLSILLPKLLT